MDVTEKNINRVLGKIKEFVNSGKEQLGRRHNILKTFVLIEEELSIAVKGLRKNKRTNLLNPKQLKRYRENIAKLQIELGDLKERQKGLENPLQGIIFYLELLLRKLEGEKKKVSFFGRIKGWIGRS